MSAFTEYAADCERKTSLNARTDVKTLMLVEPLWVTPVSGDMLAVLKTKSQRQRTRRLIMARTLETGAEL